MNPPEWFFPKESLFMRQIAWGDFLLAASVCVTGVVGAIAMLVWMLL